MDRADAHIHLFADGYPGRYGRSPAGGDELAVYQGLRREHGIGTALVVGYEGEPRFTGNNDHLAALAGRHPWIAPLAYVPAAGPAPDEMRRRFAQGFVGVAVYLPDATAADAFTRWSPAVVRLLNERGAVVSLNAPPPATGVIGGAVAALDGCSVLFSHLGLPGPAPRPDPEQAARTLEPLLHLARLAHVGVKLSGLYAISEPQHAYPHLAATPFVELTLRSFGAERLLWGSDFAPSLDAVSFAQTIDPPAARHLGAADRDKIFGGNLLRILDRHRRRTGTAPG
nr:hypothetical protein GCM10020063_008540 [Dactylosporangium thailandense]